MNKSIIILFISFFLIFNFQVSSLASSINTDNYEIKAIINTQYLLTLDNPVNNKPYQVLENNIDNCNPNLWLYSILIPGLGQIMLGDKRRGMTFTFTELGILALSLSLYSVYKMTGISEYNVAQPRTQVNTIIGIASSILGAVLLLVLPFIHVWNIIDALSLSKEMNCGNPVKKDNRDYIKSNFENSNILNFELVKF